MAAKIEGVEFGFRAPGFVFLELGIPVEEFLDDK